MGAMGTPLVEEMETHDINIVAVEERNDADEPKENPSDDQRAEAENP